MVTFLLSFDITDRGCQIVFILEERKEGELLNSGLTELSILQDCFRATVGDDGVKEKQQLLFVVK